MSAPTTDDSKLDAEHYGTYEAAKERLDQIVEDVRGKDVSLETSIDLLEEGVELANRCTELIDVAAWPDDEGEEGDGETNAPTPVSEAVDE